MKKLLAATLMALVAAPALANDDDDRNQRGCDIPSGVVNSVQSKLAEVARDGNGGLFKPNKMWSAIVDRKGRLCSVVSIGDAWPGSRAIAIAKAHTANGFSNEDLVLSTANLYSAVQPGGSLYGLNQSNPFNPHFLPQGTGIGRVPGGVITFGGGVALVSGGRVIGGLGLSGDTSCADHAIAYRMRRLANLAPVSGKPAGVINGTDNIAYLGATEAPNGFKQPHCLGAGTDVTP